MSNDPRIQSRQASGRVKTAPAPVIVDIDERQTILGARIDRHRRVSNQLRGQSSSTSADVKRSSGRRSVDVGQRQTSLEALIVRHRSMDRLTSMNVDDACADGSIDGGEGSRSSAGGAVDVDECRRSSRRWIDRRRGRIANLGPMDRLTSRNVEHPGPEPLRTFRHANRCSRLCRDGIRACRQR